MPGIIGFKDYINHSNSPILLNEMVGRLRVNSTDIAGVYSDEHINFGVMQLGTVERSEQPVWFPDHNICLAMAGEIYGYEKLTEDLRRKNYNIDDNNTPELVTALYLENGEDFIHFLNGAFSLAIWDGRSNKLILANDRLGFEPLYYTQTPDRFAFASGIRSLLADSLVSRKINFNAIAQMLTFDHILGCSTLLQDVHLLPPASVLTLENCRVNIRTYWKPEFPDEHAFRSESEYSDQLLFLLRQAAARQAPENSAGIMLSGGLDSRVVIGLLGELHSNTPLQAFTFGSPDCDDVRYAKEVAAKLNVPHESFLLRPDYLLNQAERGIQLTDGMENIVHMHTLDNLSAQAKQVRIIYKGFLGDTLTGYFSHRDFLARYTPDHLLSIFLERYPIVFQPNDHGKLFTPDFQSQLSEPVLKTAVYELTSPGIERQAADLFYYFDMHQRQRRLTLNGVQLVRSQAIVRIPFYDNDILDFMLSLPQGYRLGRYLIIQTFIKAFPELAKIPYTGTGYPMVSCRRDLEMRLNAQIRWKLRALGLKVVPEQRKRNYTNYNVWLRTVLRKWAEEILLSERFRTRGLFNQDFVRQLWQEHLDGQNHSQKLGLLISIELWNRKFIDRG